jgi:mono/diheme cytochrome c family protein
MTRTIRPHAVVAVLAVVTFSAGAVGFAQSSGEAIYKARCQMCHGATGAADTAAGKMMNTKPVSDPEVKKLTLAEMLDIARNGKNKMQAFKDKLTDAEIREAVAYFRTLMK